MSATTPDAPRPVVAEHLAARANNVQLRVADAITRFAGSMVFVYLHVALFAVWMLVLERNPWPTLTLVVSLEAIFLAIFVLISQNRMTRLADHRAHLDLQVNLLAEQESTTTLKLVQEIRAHLGIGAPSHDADVERLLAPTDVQRLSTELAEQLPRDG
jgi:uncharacterized membrane protein